MSFKHRAAALLAAGSTLALPAAAGAHVTVHPNVLPEGSYVVVDVRVPNESDSATTTKVSVQLPPGIAYAATTPVEGWTAKVTKTKLATPVKTDDGEITEEVSRIDWSGGKVAPGEFVSFPVSMQVPGQEGDTLSFKALQTYSDGEVVRWIGAADADKPAPTVAVSAPGGVIEDATGDHGSGHHGEDATADTATASAPAATVVRTEEGGKGLAIVALIVGALGLAVGAAGFSRGRKA